MGFLLFQRPKTEHVLKHGLFIKSVVLCSTASCLKITIVLAYDGLLNSVNTVLDPFLLEKNSLILVSH